MKIATGKAKLGHFATAIVGMALAAPLAWPAGQLGRVDKTRYDRCELAPTSLHDAAEADPLLVRRLNSDEAGICRERVKCWAGVNAAPKVFEAFCTAGADRTCPEALACVWDNLGLRTVAANRPPVLAGGDHIVTARVEGFDLEKVTVLTHGRTLRVPRQMIDRAIPLNEGTLVRLHMSDDQMLQYGLWTRQIAHVAAKSKDDALLDVDRLALITAGDHGRSHIIKVVE